MALMVFEKEKDGGIPVEWMRTWWGGETLPEDFVKKTVPIGFFELLGKARAASAAADALKAKDEVKSTD